MVLHNISILPQHYTASQHRRPQLDTFKVFHSATFRSCKDYLNEQELWK